MARGVTRRKKQSNNGRRRIRKYAGKPPSKRSIIHMNLHSKFKKRKIPKITTYISSALPY